MGESPLMGHFYTRKGAGSIKGEDILALDLSGLLVVTDVFLVETGTSTRHVKTLVDDAEEATRTPSRERSAANGGSDG